ncbi:ATP-binding protein [Streptomyces oryzae]|uniref:ATP-binding protein n=1 Tax=Streptomyces oryzae TaxID=1434886 RepID=A0ABS3XJY8_9ACTN|nr:ATP-binding protein [Streptomyces oryzae]MBO8195722.1 ATP-binding protein [Streptomyces oryzae]
MNTEIREIRRPEPPRAVVGTFVVQLSSTRRGARLARLLATQWLDERALPYRSAASHSAALIVAELAANAVRHCGNIGRDFRLHLDLREGVLRVEVTDARADKPLPPGTPRLPGDEEESGRGLLLVDAVADRWGVRMNDAVTKTLWAELNLPA